MSPKTNLKLKEQANLFAALGHPVRLSIVGKLSGGKPCSITYLAEGSKLTRQAVTKHIEVLEEVGIVSRVRRGRESLFELEAEAFKNMEDYLDLVSVQWDQALSRLKNFVEKE